jgi:hypothetical protein
MIYMYLSFYFTPPIQNKIKCLKNLDVGLAYSSKKKNPTQVWDR